MHLAYSAFNTNTNAQQFLSATPNQQSATEIQQRHEAYQATCRKYSREIAAIQKYLPGWQPKFY